MIRVHEQPGRPRIPVRISPDGVVIIHHHHWLAVLAPLSARELRPWSNPGRSALNLRRIVAERDILRQLRPWWAGVRGRCEPQGVSDHALMDEIAAAAAAGRIHALVALDTGDGQPMAADARARPPMARTLPTRELAAAAAPPKLSVPNMPTEARVGWVFEKAAATLGGAVGRELLQLVSPANLTIMAAGMAVLALLQLAGVGEIVDAGLALYVWINFGKSALTGLVSLIEAAILIEEATSQTQLDEAAQDVVAAAMALGGAALWAVIGRAALKRGPGGLAGGAGEQEAAASPKPDFSRPIPRRSPRIESAADRVSPGDAPGEVAATAPSGATESEVQPGELQAVNESMSARAVAYQTQITGLATDQAYVVNGVKFDGFSNGILLDAKGPGYATFVEDGEFQPFFHGADDLVDQAQRQIAAANGTPITWHVAEPEAATAIQNLFMTNGIKGITVIHTPFGS